MSLVAARASALHDVRQQHVVPSLVLNTARVLDDLLQGKRGSKRDTRATLHSCELCDEPRQRVNNCVGTSDQTETESVSHIYGLFERRVVRLGEYRESD